MKVLSQEEFKKELLEIVNYDIYDTKDIDESLSIAELEDKITKTTIFVSYSDKELKWVNNIL